MKSIEIIWHVGIGHRYGGCNIMNYQGKKPTEKQIKKYLVSNLKYLEGLDIIIDHITVLNKN